MADLQAEIQAAADEMVASGAETGLQIAVHQHGHVIADVVSGVADPRTGAEVSPGTLFYAASTAKGVAASLAHVLAERGDLGYDLRVADVWPEFGSHGKDRVTRAARAAAYGGPARPPRRDHYRAAVRLGPHVRGAGRPGALVGAGHPVRLPRADLRFPARRDHAPGHRPDRDRALARGAHRPARRPGRGLLRRPAPAAAPGGPAAEATGARRNHQKKAHRSTGPRPPRCGTPPASATAPTCSPPTSRPSAR